MAPLAELIDLSGAHMKGGHFCVDRSGARQPVPASSDPTASSSQPKMEVPAPPPHRRKTNVHLGDADACALLRRQCAQAGMPAARYVATLLVAVEEGRTQIAGKDAVEALAQSNYQLSWLGRNLRELVRKLGAMAPQHGGEADTLSLQEAIARLNAHLLRASAVLKDIETTRCTRRQVASHATRSARTKR